MNDNERKLFDLLSKRYSAPEFALIPQVRRGTGFERNIRTADAIAIGLWPSRGIEVSGFEFKSYRSDWTKELKRPDKAEEIAQFCDYWWVVASEKTIVKAEELPATWGLLVRRSDKQLITIKVAQKMKGAVLDRLFVASILRRVDQVRGEVLREKYLEGKRVGIEEQKRFAQGAVDENKYELGELRERVKAFETASGISISEGAGDHIWASAEERGRAFRLLLNGAHLKELKNLERLHTQIGEAIEKHKKGLK